VVYADRLWQYYQRTWGDPQRKASFTSSQWQVDIGKWDKTATDQGVTIYATVLAAGEAEPSGHRVEFIVGFDPEQDDIARALADVRSNPDSQRLASGSTLKFNDPLWVGTQMNSFLVLDQKSTIRPANLGETHVIFRKLVPLFEAERKLIESRGVNGLMTQWRDKAVPYWDPARPPTT
jgi:Suppressor of fused protein (SUFU)